MGLACKISGHKWNGCTCMRCGERRDEGHMFLLAAAKEGQARQCTMACHICGATRPAEHDWRGCRCTRCDATRDQDHDWNGCLCALCGKIRDEGHEWTEASFQSQSSHRASCRICKSTKTEGHRFEHAPRCRRKCTDCGYEIPWHTFRNGACINCDIDESDHYCKRILSGELIYSDRDESGQCLTNGDHVKSVPALRKLALAQKDGIYQDVRLGCAMKLADIAKAGGADAHDANLALRDLVLSGYLSWSIPTYARAITEPSIANDPRIVEAVRRVEQASIEYDNAMIAMDSGIGRSG